MSPKTDPVVPVSKTKWDTCWNRSRSGFLPLVPLVPLFSYLMSEKTERVEKWSVWKVLYREFSGKVFNPLFYWDTGTQVGHTSAEAAHA